MKFKRLNIEKTNKVATATKEDSNMKRMKKLLIALAIGFGMTGIVQAGIPADSITVTIRPNAYYAVTIATANVALDLGTVALSASTQTVSPATVTVQSTYASTDLTLEGLIESPGAGDWSFDTSSATINSNELAAWATFTDTTRVSAPSQTGSYFNGTGIAAGSDMITNAARYAGTSATNGADIYEATGESDLADMDGLSIGEQSHLWLYFRMPSGTDDNDPQSVRITLTAVAPN